MFSLAPASHFVEEFLYDNEGRPQRLDKFPMMRPIYDCLPQRLLLKCSRKTLKSTLLSNLIALNMLRWNYYKILYVAPQEASTAYFSNNYVVPRFESPNVKKLFVKGWDKNDVYAKIFGDTRSSVNFKYAKDDATRIRGLATDHNFHDEVQDIGYEILPVIKETMALSEFKREIFAGTPLTTDNTINQLWKTSNQLEWATKCEGCNHWNTITMDNEPLKMLMPEGFCCSKCSKILNTINGEWVSFNPSTKSDLVGFHLAQPLLPYFNQSKKEWKAFYSKINEGNYGLHQIYNEALGLAYDVGTKPITEEQLKACCVLGKMEDKENKSLPIYQNNKWKYRIVTCGNDWGVNQTTSRTVTCMGGLREDGVFEVFYAKCYKDFDHKAHVRDIAELANAVNAFCASDSGPSPDRGIMLTELTSPSRSQLVRYEHGKVIQRFDQPSSAWDWRQNRWVLHRSDTLSFTLELIKQKKILFPQWDEMSDILQDILNVFIETKDGLFRQELFYRHGADAPDDFLHALNWAVCQAYVALGDSVLSGPSTSAENQQGFTADQ